MSDPHLLSPSLHPAPWHIVTEHRGRLDNSIHTLHHGNTATEQRTGPHGLSLLSDIRDHLNQCGGKPALPKHKPATANQPSLL